LYMCQTHVLTNYNKETHRHIIKNMKVSTKYENNKAVI